MDTGWFLVLLVYETIKLTLQSFWDWKKNIAQLKRIHWKTKDFSATTGHRTAYLEHGKLWTIKFFHQFGALWWVGVLAIDFFQYALRVLKNKTKTYIYIRNLAVFQHGKNSLDFRKLPKIIKRSLKVLVKNILEVVVSYPKEVDCIVWDNRCEWNSRATN